MNIYKIYEKVLSRHYFLYDMAQFAINHIDGTLLIDSML